MNNDPALALAVLGLLARAARDLRSAVDLDDLAAALANFDGDVEGAIAMDVWTGAERAVLERALALARAGA